MDTDFTRSELDVLAAMVERQRNVEYRLLDGLVTHNPDSPGTEEVRRTYKLLCNLHGKILHRLLS